MFYFFCKYFLVKYLFLDRTPMHLAAERGHATVIELLADKFKASILERTKDGSTLMHIASLNGHADCAMMLFKKGVYLHMPNKVRKYFYFYLYWKIILIFDIILHMLIITKHAIEIFKF